MKTSSQPSDVLIFRGLTAEITEKMIFQKIEELGFVSEYVRIPRDNLKKTSKGLAIVKFKSISESVRFLENYPVIEVIDSSLWLDFGFEHSIDDWTCTNCRTLNFKNREICFKCAASNIHNIQKIENEGQDDVSNQRTRFILIRNLDENLSPQCIFDKIFLFESELKRVWRLINRETGKYQNFAFLEFFSENNAELYLNRQLSLDVPFKIECNILNISFGRDLSLLSRSLSGTMYGKISYWDNTLEFSEYPSYVVNIPETLLKSDQYHYDIPTKRNIIGAFPILSQPIAKSKTIKLQLKNWTEKAKLTTSESDNSSKSIFTPETFSNNSKNKFIDLTFLCCLLCDIKFSSESELMEHVQNSIEHADKFELYWKKSVLDGQNEEKLYHDRAAERRDAFGISEEELKKIQDEQSRCKGPNIKSNELQTDQIPAHLDSVGAKLLKKMGWKEGTGLGKNSSGIIEPIKAKTIEHSGAGIGATNLISADSIKPKSYTDTVRNDRFKRYKE